MKFIFICLFIANILLFALGWGYLVDPIAESHQPQRLSLQPDGQQLILIPAETALAPAAGSAVNEATHPDVIACLEWGTFKKNEVKHVEAKLKSLSFGNRQSRHRVPDTTTTMVFIPSLGSKEAADKKAAELRRLGVSAFYIVQDPPDLQWGISLGVFSSAESAKQLLAKLAAKGVRSAKIGARNALLNRFSLKFKDVNGAEKTNLDKLLLEFPGQTLKICN
ncbi:MAG: hypothetical protein K0R08_384 [Solimicrobium sp.]|jgi:hypothetical protein|nr:hypothetical protein [Solimicrobium sp.]